MGELIVVTGPPGAGKSTVAALVADHVDPSALVRGDDFFAFLRRGAVAPWLPEAGEQNAVVTRAAAAATGQLTQRSDVVYDGVVGPWFLDTFVEHCGLDHLSYAVLLPPLEVCLDRVASRTGHGFRDRDAAEHMWREFADASLDARHLLRGVVPAEEAAREILALASAGTLRHARAEAAPSGRPPW